VHFSRVNILMLVLMSILIVPIMSHSVLGWWNESWEYRKVITVNNVKLNFTNGYNFRLNVTWEDGMQQDFGDLRFTWLNTSATPRTEEEVDYCIGGIGCDVWYDADKKYKLNYVNGKYADVIIKVPKLSENHNETIFMYFGNDNVADNSKNGYGLYYNDFDFVVGHFTRYGGTCCWGTDHYFNHSDRYGNTVSEDWGIANSYYYDGSYCSCSYSNTWASSSGISNTDNSFLIAFDDILNEYYVKTIVRLMPQSAWQPYGKYGIGFNRESSGRYLYLIYNDVAHKHLYQPSPYGWYSLIGTFNTTNIRGVIINDTNIKSLDYTISGNFPHIDINHIGIYTDSSSSVGFDNIVVRSYQSPEPTLSISPTQSRIYTSPFQLNWLSSLKYYFDNVVAYFLVTIIIIIVSYLTVYATKSTIVGILVGLLLDMALTVVELYPLWAGITLGLIFGAILLWGEKRE